MEEQKPNEEEIRLDFRMPMHLHVVCKDNAGRAYLVQKTLNWEEVISIEETVFDGKIVEDKCVIITRNLSCVAAIRFAMMHELYARYKIWAYEEKFRPHMAFIKPSVN